ncbi:sugar phosphate nucleotidyltransferase [Paenibacillus sp.]|uniref:sugar phosphate nucleotidyltransferase n=1 Tax=Paenibacillus sp. TaxID=58172 RepID=UPI003561BDE3
MKSQSCVAMLLAGGEGRRLGVLTRDKAKPAVHFGGGYRMIDFALSNCTNSGLPVVGVVTQYQAASLHRHIGSGALWSNAVTLLPSAGGSYTGTADAVFKNMAFLKFYDPEHVLVLSGDHIYRMDYRKLLERHRETGADATIAVTPVAWEEAHRFGIMKADKAGRITEFAEKPRVPTSNLASMGIYVFRWSYLKHILERDACNPLSSHDFGKDLIPSMLARGDRVQTYAFEGYWRDVGTVESLWEAHMDLLGDPPKFDLEDGDWPMRSPGRASARTQAGLYARLRHALVAGESAVFGQIERSVLSAGVFVGHGSVLRNCVVMPRARIGRDVFIRNAIIGEGAVIEDGATVGSRFGEPVTVIGDAETVGRPVTVIGDAEPIGEPVEFIPKAYVPIRQYQFERIR